MPRNPYEPPREECREAKPPPRGLRRSEVVFRWGAVTTAILLGIALGLPAMVSVKSPNDRPFKMIGGLVFAGFFASGMVTAGAWIVRRMSE